MKEKFYQDFLKSAARNEKLLAILVDPEKFNSDKTDSFLKKIPNETTHLFVGGSTGYADDTEKTLKALKKKTKLPLFLFPGDYSHISNKADVLLFLTLLSGRNPEYLVAQQVKSILKLKGSTMEIIPTGYLLIDGGTVSAVAKVTGTQPMAQDNVQNIVDTALAGQFMGAKLIYLEAGSGANHPV